MIIFCTLIFVECSARGIITFREDIRPEKSEWFVYSPELGWEKRPGFIGSVEHQRMPPEAKNHRREFDREGFFAEDSAQVADGGVGKIITLGDSSTFGYGVASDLSYAEQLDGMLPDMHVINLGVSGYTSYQGWKVLEKYFFVLNPSVIIVSFNFNDRRYVLDPDDIDSERKFRRDMDSRRFTPFLQKVYLYRLLRALMLKLPLMHEVDDTKANVVDLRTLEVRVPPDKYRENLAKMAGLAKAHGIPLIFLVLNDNPLETQYLNRGLGFLERTEYERAVRELTIGRRTVNYSTDLASKYLAKVYEVQNAPDKVDQAVRIEEPSYSLHGGNVLFRDTEYNGIMREVGREYGATVVEAGRILNEDPSLYLDNCHPDERGHRIIAQLLYTAVQELKQKLEEAPVAQG